jgi:ADP-ribose pyrophosphatase YjhB (NUDIX family)
VEWGGDVNLRAFPEAVLRAVSGLLGAAFGSRADEPLTLAGALIADGDGRVLLLHRNTPDALWWEVPGGKVESGESNVDAACRELAEELNARVEVIRELGTGDFDHDGQRLRYTWYLAQVVDGEPRVAEPDRFDRISYFTVDEAAALDNPSPSLRRLFELYGGALSELRPECPSACAEPRQQMRPA